jgi:hypothetical protein
MCLRDTPIFVLNYTLRRKYPDGYEKAIRFQTQSLTSSTVIVLYNIILKSLHYMFIGKLFLGCRRFLLLALSGGRIGLAGSIYCGWCVVQCSSNYGLVSLGAKKAVIGACGAYRADAL